MRHDAVIEVSVETLQNVARLETSWKELEARANHSFYLSWLWIGSHPKIPGPSSQAKLYVLPWRVVM